MQQNPSTTLEQATVTVEASSVKPVELNASLLAQVSGAGPNGNWASTAAFGPNGNWAAVA